MKTISRQRKAVMTLAILAYILLYNIPAVAQNSVAAETVAARVARMQLEAMGNSGQPRKVAEQRHYAVYAGSTTGFVVVSAESAQPRVMAYSSSAWNADRLPCGLRWWLAAAGEGRVAAAPEAAGGYPSVPNFVTTKWGQDTPFNDKCPEDGGTKAPTGCIATAMAQVMRYYQWPQQGQGSGFYTIGADSDHPVAAAVDATYNWNLMPASVRYSASTRLQVRDAVSSLMFDCGKAVHMNYAAEGSGAYDWNQALALARNFQYDSLSLRRCERAFYDDEEWMGMIATEMAARRPILYSGSSEADGGHAFVFSGMDSEGRVYVNWGWDGDCDGFYDVNVLTPMYYGDGAADFTENQSMNIGIVPQGVEGLPGSYESKWVAYYVASPELNRSGKELRIPYYYVYNIQYLPFTGVIGLLFESTDGNGYSAMVAIDGDNTETLECYDGYTNYEPSHHGETSGSSAVTVSTAELAAGTYRVTWVSKAVQESDPQPMIQKDGTLAAPFFLTKSSSGKLTLSSSDPSGISGVTADGDAPVRMYDVSGRRVSGTARGLTIVRCGSSVRKTVGR